MRSLRASPAEIKSLLRRASTLELSSDAVQRLKWFSYALAHGGNVSLTCRHFGIARSTFLQWAERFDPRDISTLEAQSRRPHHVRSSQVAPAVVQMIRDLRIAQPELKREQIVVFVEQRCGIMLSASTVGRIITRHQLFFKASAAHLQKRGVFDVTSSDEPQTQRGVLPQPPATDSPFPLLPNPEPLS